MGRGRTAKALFTESERDYLKGCKRKLDSKAISKFKNSLETLVEECINDLRMLSECKEPYIRSWCHIHSDHLSELTRFRWSAIERSYTGRIKKTVVSNNGKRRTLYWFDAKDTPKWRLEDLSKPEHRLIGIKGRKVRSALIGAIRFQDRLNESRGIPAEFEVVRQDILASRESDALSLEEITDRVRRIRRILDISR